MKRGLAIALRLQDIAYQVVKGWVEAMFSVPSASFLRLRDETLRLRVTGGDRFEAELAAPQVQQELMRRQTTCF